MIDDPEPPVPGVLPALEDPTTGTSEGFACSTTTPTALRSDGQLKVSDHRTDWDFLPDAATGKKFGRIRINSYATPVGQKVLSQVTVQYKVTATKGCVSRDMIVSVDVDKVQGGNPTLGGTELTTFDPPIAANSTVQVDLTFGSGAVKIGNATAERFGVEPASQGAKIGP